MPEKNNSTRGDEAVRPLVGPTKARPARWCVAAIIGLSAGSLVGGALIYALSLSASVRLPLVPSLYENGSFAEVFRMAPLCIDRSMREGLSYGSEAIGWGGGRMVADAPTRYGVWHFLMPANTTNVLVNVGRTLRFETRADADRVMTANKPLPRDTSGASLAQREREWCPYAHERGFSSIQVRSSFGRSVLILCDDANNRSPNVGACAPGPYFTPSMSACECSDTSNALNCDGAHARPLRCEDATPESFLRGHA